MGGWHTCAELPTHKGRTTALARHRQSLQPHSKLPRSALSVSSRKSLTNRTQMNNPISHALRRPGDPAPVSLAYPSSHPGANSSLLSSAHTSLRCVRERERERGCARTRWSMSKTAVPRQRDGTEYWHVFTGLGPSGDGALPSRRARGGQLGPPCVAKSSFFQCLVVTRPSATGACEKM